MDKLKAVDLMGCRDMAAGSILERAESPYEVQTRTPGCFPALFVELTGRALVAGQFGFTSLGWGARLPRSLHYATRRTQTVRKKKPGRFGRDDEKIGISFGTVSQRLRTGLTCAPPLVLRITEAPGPAKALRRFCAQVGRGAHLPVRSAVCVVARVPQWKPEESYGANDLDSQA
jgi:hypothetical protein